MKKKRFITWINPEKIELKISKNGAWFIYDYKEFMPLLDRKKYGEDDTQKLYDTGYIQTQMDCKVLKFESNNKYCHVILKTKNPLRLLLHLIHEIGVLGKPPITEEDTLQEISNSRYQRKGG